MVRLGNASFVHTRPMAGRPGTASGAGRLRRRGSGFVVFGIGADINVGADVVVVIVQIGRILYHVIIVFAGIGIEIDILVVLLDGGDTGRDGRRAIHAAAQAGNQGGLFSTAFGADCGNAAQIVKAGTAGDADAFGAEIGLGHLATCRS